jgi:broad specificity phosphatase PhoE
MSNTQWWWIRHAPVPDGGRIYGQRDLDCDCTDAGIFAALARELPREAVWVTSQLRRATQTAAAIHAAMGQPHQPVVVPELAEQHLGEWQGLDRQKFLASRVPRRPFWFAAASERAPGGESFDDLVARAHAAIHRLNQQFAGRTIVAVAHGGTIKAALRLALRLESEAALAFVGLGPRDGVSLGGVLDQGVAAMLLAPHVLVVGAASVFATSAAMLAAGRAVESRY